MAQSTLIGRQPQPALELQTNSSKGFIGFASTEKVERVTAVRAAFIQHLQQAGPKPDQLAWRLGRFVRGHTLLTEIEPIVGTHAGRSLIDLGAAHCGDAAAALAHGMDITVADFRDHRHADFKRQLAPFGEISSVLFNVNDEWPLPAHAFDAALALGLLEHVTSLDQFFRKLHAILKPGGFAVTATALAIQGVHRDPLFGTRGTSMLPMKLRRLVAERWMGRQYGCPIANRTHYTAGPIVRAAQRAGLTARLFKYTQSRALRRVSRWPASSLWKQLLNHVAADYILIRKPEDLQPR